MADKKDFSCPECAAEFNTREELDGHDNKVHNKQSSTKQPTEKPPEKRTA